MAVVRQGLPCRGRAAHTRILFVLLYRAFLPTRPLLRKQVACCQSWCICARPLSLQVASIDLCQIKSIDLHFVTFWTFLLPSLVLLLLLLLMLLSLVLFPLLLTLLLLVGVVAVAVAAVAAVAVTVCCFC